MSQPVMQSSRIAMHRVVVDAICALGTGFVDASTDPKCAQDLLGELIGLTYRLICMAIMEQKNKNESLLHAVQKPQAWKELCVYMEQYGAQMNEHSARRLWSVSVFPHLLTMKCDDDALKNVVQKITELVQNQSIQATDLGWTYEVLLSYQARIHGGIFSIHRAEHSSQKLTGAHYTPKELVESVLEQTLRPVLKGVNKEAGPSIQLCDPSCGSGLFLLEAAFMIAKEYSGGSLCEKKEQQILCDVMETCIYGVDINPISVDVCILSLWLASGMSLQTLGLLDAHIRQGNSVLDLDLYREKFDTFPPKDGFFSWSDAFPSVFVRENSGFDCIVGNPPWISFSGRHAHSLSALEKRIYQSLYDGFVGWLTLHSVFVEQALHRIRNGGFLGLVLPRQLADLAGYAAIRKIVRMQSAVQEPLLDFGEGAFDGVEQPSFALVTQKTGTGTEGDGIFVLRSSGSYQDIIDGYMSRLQRCSKPPKESFRDIGVHTGNCANKLILKQYRDGCAPIYEGKNILPFHLEPAKRWIHVQYEKQEGEYYTIRSIEDYKRVRIVIRQTGHRPIASKHSTKSFFRNSILACYGIEQWSDDETVSWLNSTVVAFFHINSIPESRQQAFPQVKIGHLRNLPLPRGSITLVGDKEGCARSDLQVSRAFGLSLREHRLLCALYDFQRKKQRYDILRAKPKLSVKKKLYCDQLIADIDALKKTIDHLLSHVED